MTLSLTIWPHAPTGSDATEYDVMLLATYAALIDADRACVPWRTAAARYLGLDPDTPGSKACWSSHLARAHWSVGEGLAAMIVAATPA